MSSPGSPLFDFAKADSESYDYACVSQRLLLSRTNEDGPTSFVQFAPMIRATPGSESTEAKMCVGVIRSDDKLNSLMDEVGEGLTKKALGMKWLHQKSQIEAKGKTMLIWARTVSVAVKDAASNAKTEAGRSEVLFEDRVSMVTNERTWEDTLLSHVVLNSIGDKLIGEEGFVIATKPIRLWPAGTPSASWNVNGGHFPPAYTRVAYKLVGPGIHSDAFSVTNYSGSTLDKTTKDQLDKAGGSSSHRPFRDLWNKLIRTGNPQTVSFVMADLAKKERESLAGAAEDLNLQVEDSHTGYTVQSSSSTGAVGRYHDDPADDE
jgi:hypothetical protein